MKLVHQDASLPEVPAQPGSTTRRRVLLLSHAFAPSRLIGALRWTRMVELLAAYGYQFDVVTAAVASDAAEYRMLEGLPRGTRVFVVEEPPPGRWNRAMRVLTASNRWIARHRGDVAKGPSMVGGSSREQAESRFEVARALRRLAIVRALDESEVRWAKRAGRLTRRTLSMSGYDAIISSGPPHFVQLIASDIAREAQLPHIADLRDPWSHWSWTDDAQAGRLSDALRRPRETRVVTHASLVITTSQRHAEALTDAYPAQAERIHAILNGIDEAPLPESVDDGVFRIAYSGVLYLDRNPRRLFRAIRAFLTSTGATPAMVRVEFMGDVELYQNASVRSIAESEGISEWLTLTPHRPRDEALALLARSHVLVNLAEGLRETIAAKVFEYVRFPAWILLIGPAESATRDLLEGAGALCAEPHDIARMQEHLTDCYARFRQGGRPLPIAQVVTLSRARQASKLAELLDATLAAHSAAAR